MTDTPCRGRFAPSPTGPLHFGSLLAAVGSFLDARAQHGSWLLRMEDLDPPREIAGAADDILRTLEAFGLHWDGAVMYQSRRHAAYQAALDELEQQQCLYPCGCSRRDIQALSVAGKAAIYPGTCRNGLPPGREARAVRIRVPDASIHFDDRVQGHMEMNLAEQNGDFILRRADGPFAYHLAMVIDDAAQGITDIVRGADLLDCTAPQIFLQQTLGYTTPRYLHLPVVVNAQGEKLSKQTHAPAVSAEHAITTLGSVLQCLGQALPDADTLDDFWQQAIHNWQLTRIPRTRSINEH